MSENRFSDDVNYVQELFEEDPPIQVSLSLLVFNGGDPFVYGVNFNEEDSEIADQIADLWMDYWDDKKGRADHDD